MVRIWSALSVLFVFLCVVLGFGEGQLTILWPDVEQGACMLVVGPEVEGIRTAILVDAGTTGSKPEEDPITTIGEFLKKNPSVVIKFVVITHQHADHNSWIPPWNARGCFRLTWSGTPVRQLFQALKSTLEGAQSLESSSPMGKFMMVRLRSVC